MNVPVMLLNSSPARWIEVPLPLDAMFSLPGLALAYLMKSCTLWMFSVLAFSAFISITLGTAATSVIGTKSLIGSKGSLGYSARLMPCVPTVPMSSV